MTLWGKIIHQQFGDCCAKCKTTAGKMEAHHIGGRQSNAMGLDLELGILLCDECHLYAPDAPHRDHQAFMKWLEEAYPQKFQRYQESRHKIIFDRDFDIKTITAQLRSEAKHFAIA